MLLLRNDHREGALRARQSDRSRCCFTILCMKGISNAGNLPV